MTDRLFVYGTLAPGRPNEHVLADVEGTWEPATVKGTLLQEGWGAAAGYPGIVLDDRGVMSMGSSSAPRHCRRFGTGWMLSRAMAMRASSRRWNLKTARLSRRIFMLSSETARPKIQQRVVDIYYHFASRWMGMGGLNDSSEYFIFRLHG